MIPKHAESSDYWKEPRSKSQKAKTFRRPYGTGEAHYFNLETEKHIIHYNSMTDEAAKHAYYEEHLHAPLSKLCECVLNGFNFEYVQSQEDLRMVKDELLSHVVSKIDTFNPAKGFKAFSYFTVIVRNYLIQWNEKVWKRNMTDIPIVEVHDEDSDDVAITLKTDYGYDREELTDFIDEIMEYFESNQSKFQLKPVDKRIFDAILNVMKHGDFTSKSGKIRKGTVFQKLREDTGFTTLQISRVIKKMKRHYQIQRQEWLNQLPNTVQ